MSEPTFNRIKSLESPAMDFRGAASSALRLVQLEKEAFVLQGQIQAKAQVIRAIWGVVAAICVVVALLINVFWISWHFYQRGATPLELALASLVIFGGIAAFCIWRTIREI